MDEKKSPLSDVCFCKYLHECQIFGFHDMPSSVEAALKTLYCFNKPHFDRCRRRQYWLAHGERPPDALLPSGRMLPEYTANAAAPVPEGPHCERMDSPSIARPSIARRSLEKV